MKLIRISFCFSRRSKEKILWRRVCQDLRDTYTDGREFSWWSFSSCSSKVKTMESMSFDAKNQSFTLFSIETKSGRSLRNHSAYPTEDEVLLPPGRQIRVISHYDMRAGVSIIQIKEVKPPFKMLSPPFPMPEEQFNPYAKKKSKNSVDLSIMAEKLSKENHLQMKGGK